MATEKSTFGAGCFWGVEAAFRQVPGVVSTAVGYMGGQLKNPTYRDVCTDQTGHAEVVEVTFDPPRGQADLLKVFWASHDLRNSTGRAPTTAHNIAPRYSSIPPNRRRRPERQKRISIDIRPQPPVRVCGRISQCDIVCRSRVPTVELRGVVGLPENL